MDAGEQPTSGQLLPSVAPRISLLDADPELMSHIAEPELGRARRAVTAPLVVLANGPFEPASVLAAGRNAFGALIISGLLSREVSVGDQPTLRLHGPGDMLHARPLAAGMLDADQVWSASAPTRLALLDDQFLQAVRHWPRLVTALFDRAADRHDATLLQLVVSQHPRVEDRLADLFLALAERWGRVTPHGVLVPLALTHEALARLVGARRPTVTLALKVLAEDGRLQRSHDGGWLIAMPEAAEAEPLKPLLGKSRPRLVRVADANPGTGVAPMPYSMEDLIERAQELALGQAHLQARCVMLASRTAAARRRTEALLEDADARRSNGAPVG